ncbi:MAG: hypothetical protein N2Z68_02155 [Patescibacteria group bacterium]|nr:hypothetical protein [Patescibacteria group bacterium]
MKDFFQKLVSLFILFSLLAEFSLALFLAKPKVAEAAWPTSVLADIQGALKWLWEKAEKIWDKLDKKYRDLVVRLIIMKMQQDIVKSIEEGSLYVSDWGSFLKEEVTNIAFNEFNDYVRKISNGEIDLCSPFSTQMLSLSLAASLGLSGGTTKPYYGLPISCTFDEFKANLKNTAEFIQRGGWASLDIAFSPGVNPYWVSWQLHDSFIRKMAEEKEKRKSEAESSGGFLGQKTCLANKDGTTREEAVAFCSGKDANGNPEYKAQGFNSVSECVEGLLRDQATGGGCAQEGILTPGQMVSDAIMEAMGGDFDYSANVQSAIAAIVNAIVAKMIREGLSSGSKGGDSYGVESGDLAGTGFENFEGNRFKQDLEDAQQKYQEVITYLEQDLIPATDQILSLIQSKNLEDPNCSVRNMQVEVDEGGGTKKIYTVAELVDLVKNLNAVALQAKAEAEANKNEIDSLLSQENPPQTEAMNALNKLSSFERNYQIIVQDVELVNGGQEGTLLLMLSNIYTVLSRDDINCAAPPSSP